MILGRSVLIAVICALAIVHASHAQSLALEESATAHGAFGESQPMTFDSCSMAFETEDAVVRTDGDLQFESGVSGAAFAMNGKAHIDVTGSSAMSKSVSMWLRLSADAQEDIPLTHPAGIGVYVAAKAGTMDFPFVRLLGDKEPIGTVMVPVDPNHDFQDSTAPRSVLGDVRPDSGVFNVIRDLQISQSHVQEAKHLKDGKLETLFPFVSNDGTLLSDLQSFSSDADLRSAIEEFGKSAAAGPISAETSGRIASVFESSVLNAYRKERAVYMKVAQVNGESFFVNVNHYNPTHLLTNAATMKSASPADYFGGGSTIEMTDGMAASTPFMLSSLAYNERNDLIVVGGANIPDTGAIVRVTRVNGDVSLWYCVDRRGSEQAVLLSLSRPWTLVSSPYATHNWAFTKNADAQLQVIASQMNNRNDKKEGWQVRLNTDGVSGSLIIRSSKADGLTYKADFPAPAVPGIWWHAHVHLGMLVTELDGAEEAGGPFHHAGDNANHVYINGIRMPLTITHNAAERSTAVCTSCPLSIGSVDGETSSCVPRFQGSVDSVVLSNRAAPRMGWIMGSRLSSPCNGNEDALTAIVRSELQNVVVERQMAHIARVSAAHAPAAMDKLAHFRSLLNENLQKAETAVALEKTALRVTSLFSSASGSNPAALPMTRRIEASLSEMVRTDSFLAMAEISALLGRLSGTCPDDSVPVCYFASPYYRRIDGKCNNLMHPLWGASGRPFQRRVAHDYDDGIRSVRSTGLPSARMVTNTMMHVLPDAPKSGPLSHMHMTWGQFIDHDLDLTASSTFYTSSCRTSCSDSFSCAPIPVHPMDSDWGSSNGQYTPRDCLPFTRSAHVCGTGVDSAEPREQMNQITSYIDASMVYGSNTQRADALRTFVGGQLKTHVTADGEIVMPLDSNPDNAGVCGNMTCQFAGDVRANEVPGLTSMHIIWVREHNRIAAQLAMTYPTANDELLYQEARKIVSAEIQHITYNEYLPLTLGDADIPAYSGYDPTRNADVLNEFATAAFRFGHSQIAPHFFRFTADDYSTTPTGGHLKMRDSFFNADLIQNQGGPEPFLRGDMYQQAGEADQFMTLDISQSLFGPATVDGLDLGALNIQRGRDHGLGGFNAYRVHYGLAPFTSWANYSDASPIQTVLNSMYGDVDEVDLWVGGLLEDQVPNGAVGETFAKIIGDQFAAVRDGDRFWYENVMAYTPAQTNKIKGVTLASVICLNTGINVINPNPMELNQEVSSYSFCKDIPAVDYFDWHLSAMGCFDDNGHLHADGALWTSIRADGPHLCRCVGGNQQCFPQLLDPTDWANAETIKAPKDGSILSGLQLPLMDDDDDRSTQFRPDEIHLQVA